MSQGNQIQLEQMGDTVLFDIQGDLTVQSEPILKGAYESANEQEARKILLRFQDGAYINSGGIAVLIQFLSQTRKNNQRIGILGLSDHFKKIFNMVGITKFATIYQTQEEALKGLSDGR